MNVRDFALGMAAYNSWMNKKIYDSSAELSDLDRKRDLGAFFKSVHGTLNHILVADESWLQRFRGQPVTMISPAQEMHASFAELRAGREKMDGEITEWVATLDAGFGDRPFRFYSVTYQKERVIPGWAAVAHMFNHQSHHRGQVTTLLKQLGRDPGLTDLPWMPYFDEPG